MPSSNKKQLAFLTCASSIGSLLEMYDFVIYAIFASVLGKLFFPDSNQYMALLQVYAVFAIGYLSRPIGGIVFGYISDRTGRQRGLILSMICMGLPIFLIGCLPTFRQWGDCAPTVLLLLRFIGGISVGGEFPSGTAYLSEYASSFSRGLVVSFLFFGINLGIVLASLFGMLLISHLTESDLLSWGWRIPFLLGGFLAIIGLLIRKRMEESPAFLNHKKENKLARNPVLAVLHKESRQITQSITVNCVMAAAISLVFLYMPVYLHNYLGIKTTDAFYFNTLNSIVFTLLIPVFAWLSDKTGRNFILSIGAYLFLFLSIPLYHGMASRSEGTILFCLICLGVFTAMIVGPMSATLSERFRTQYRTSGIGLSYNISFGLIGGLAPVSVTFLIQLSKTALAPAFYLMVTALLSLIAIINLRDFSRVPLEKIEARLTALSDQEP